MVETFDLIIHNGTCVTPSGRAETNVGVRYGKIVAIGDLDPSSAETAFDAKVLHVLPGVIDSQVHFREPGVEHKEDLAHRQTHRTPRACAAHHHGGRNHVAGGA